MSLRPLLLFCVYFFSFSSSVCFAQQPRLVLPIGHPQGVIDIKSTPDGKYILSKSYNDNNIKVWETKTGKLIFDLKMEGGASEMKISPSGKYVFIIGQNDSSIIWNLFTGAPEIIINENFNHAYYSQNGKFLLTYKDNNVQVWDAATGQVLHTHDSQDSIISAGYFNNDRNILIAKKENNKTGFYLLDAELNTSSQIHYPGTIDQFYFYDFRDSLYLVQFDLKDAYIHQLAYDSLSIKKTIKVKNLKSSVVNHSFSERDGNLLLGMKDKTVHLLNLKEGIVYSYAKFKYGFDNVEFVDSGRHFIVKDGFEGLYFNTKNGVSIQYFNYFRESQDLKNVGGVIAVNDKQKRFYLALEDNIIREYKTGADTCVLSQMFTGQTQSLNFFSLSNESLIIGDGKGYVKIINLIKDEVVNYYNAHSDFMSGMSFSSSKQLIATCSWDHSVKIWNTVTNKMIKKITKKDPVISVKISNSNDRMVLITKEDIESFSKNIKSSVEVIDLKTYKGIKKLNSRDRLFSANFSNDGSMIFYCNQTDSTVIICDLNLKINRKLKVTGWLHDAYQSENGRFIVAVTESSIDLFDFQTNHLLRSFSIENTTGGNTPATSKDGSLLAAGTGRGSMNVWDIKSGELLYCRKLHSSSLTPVFTNESELLTCSEDGTIKYWKFDRKDVYPVYQTAPFKKSEYITVIPAGFYKGSRNASKLLHYVTKDLKIISFEQLDVKYNRPDKVLEAIGSADTTLIKSYRKAYEKRIKKLGIDTTAFRSGYSIPEADFANRDNIEYEQKNGRLKLEIKSGDSTYKLDRFNVWVNETPVFGQRGISLRNKDRNNFDSTILIDLSAGENRIETSITNVNGTESYRMPLMVNHTPAIKQKEKTYFIGIGIDKFSDSKYNLKYSAKDIRDLCIKLKEKCNNIIIDTLFNENVTVSNVKALKQKLQQTSVNDKVNISYSGHGLLSKDFDYYLSTYNINFENPEQNGLPYEELENLLDSIPARKKLLLIDACHSGEVDKEEGIAMNNSADSLGRSKGVIIKNNNQPQLGLKNSFELMQSLFVNVGKSTGATIISAAAGNQFALERGDLKNGVFTYAILEAMNAHHTIKVSELKKIVGERVEQLTNGMQKPTSRNEMIAVDWEVW